MRIAIVGKWGSGKTSVSALLTSYLAHIGQHPLLIDADINIHQPILFLGDQSFPQTQRLSTSQNVEAIKTYLKWNNHRIESLASFRKTTPPGLWSNIFQSYDFTHHFYTQFAQTHNNVSLMVVWTYTEKDIGASCYHNNLAIVENILSHTDDRNHYVLVDMVAGTDAFSGSLHAQFDIILLAVEPTKKWIEVRNQYAQLARIAGVYDQLYVIGNKCHDEEDKAYLQQHIPSDKLLVTLGISPYLRQLEKTGGIINFSALEEESQNSMTTLYHMFNNLVIDPNRRLKKLQELHHIYVGQEFIIQRFGDLTNQIDPDFSFPTIDNA